MILFFRELRNILKAIQLIFNDTSGMMSRISPSHPNYWEKSVFVIYSFEQRKISTMPKYGNHHVITSNSPVLLLQAAPRTGHKNNLVAAAFVAATTFRVRFCSSLPQRRMVPPATVVVATMSVSDSILRCCKGEWPACRPPLTRGCSQAQTWESMQGFPQNQPKCCSDS